MPQEKQAGRVMVRTDTEGCVVGLWIRHEYAGGEAVLTPGETELLIRNLSESLEEVNAAVVARAEREADEAAGVASDVFESAQAAEIDPLS